MGAFGATLTIGLKVPGNTKYMTSKPVGNHFMSIVHRLSAVLCTSFSLLYAGSAVAADITAYTTDWPPYEFEVKGKVTGISTDVLNAACREAGLSCDISVTPWARAYATVERTPNTLLYTTARIPSRENSFLWVGPILPRVTWVYGSAGSQNKIKTFKDLAEHKIGVIRGEAPIKDLEAIGVPPDAMVIDSSNAMVLKQLIKGWVDAMVDTEIGMAWNLRESQVPANSVTRLMKLSDQGAYYFALNLDSDPKLHARLQSAVDKLRSSGIINHIVEQYGHPGR